MANIDDELQQDQLDMQKELAWLHQQMPIELKDKYSRDTLQWILETAWTWYLDHDTFATDDEEIEIDLDRVAADICQCAKEENMPTLDPEDVALIIGLDLDFEN